MLVVLAVIAVLILVVELITPRAPIRTSYRYFRSRKEFRSLGMRHDELKAKLKQLEKACDSLEPTRAYVARISILTAKLHVHLLGGEVVLEELDKARAALEKAEDAYVRALKYFPPATTLVVDTQMAHAA